MLILASNSPRRKELLKNAGFEFKIIPSECEETVPPISPQKAAIAISRVKAEEVAKKHLGNVILAADTIVVLNGEILGKPNDEADAYRMLKKLSGRTHKVITGVSVLKSNILKTFAKETEVEFFKLSDKQIFNYIKTSEPFDKAGAYGIQEKGALLVKGIKGDYFNVMGLPIAKTARILKEFGIKPDWVI